MIKVDIYFREEYAKIYEMNGEGEVEVYNYMSLKGRVRYIFLKRKINLLEKEYYDIITPYGYGGPQFFPRCINDLEALVLEFKKDFENYCFRKSIVSEFIRFHPLLKNYRYMWNYMKLLNIGSTIFINLENKEQMMINATSKCRNAIRKAIKNNLIIREDPELKTIENFKRMYSKTMEKNNADSYYFFNDDYFINIMNLLKENVTIFNAYKDQNIIASTMILKGEDSIHYHLSANTSLGYKLAANPLLIFSIGEWGRNRGFKKFHLGGGYGGDESPLFKFKRSFNTSGILKFYVGEKIHNYNTYIKLVEKAESINSNRGGKNKDFFPLYRR